MIFKGLLKVRNIDLLEIMVSSIGDIINKGCCL